MSFEPNLKLAKYASSPDLPHHTSKVHFKEVSKARVDLEVKYKLIFFHHKPHNPGDFSEDLGYLFVYLFIWYFIMRVFKVDGFLAALIEITSTRSDRCFLGFRGCQSLESREN